VPLRSAQEAIVRDVYEVLREKEGAIEQVRREVEALYSVTPLLSDANATIPQLAVGGEARTDTVSQQLAEALRTVAPLLVDQSEDFDPEIRARLVEGAEKQLQSGGARRISRQLGNLQRLCCSVFLLFPARKLRLAHLWDAKSEHSSHV
jgi:hypothetical protein